MSTVQYMTIVHCSECGVLQCVYFKCACACACMFMTVIL